MLKWIKSISRATVIKNSFLIPILSVVLMSISHVISWYDLGNPMSWAIYLSIAVEIFALASVSAASINIKKGSIWLLFILVTLIQITGNVYFTFQEIDVTSDKFLSWVELINPWFNDWDIIDHRRFLSYIQGGTLPFMSLIALHFYIVFNEKTLIVQEPEVVQEVAVEEVKEPKVAQEPEVAQEVVAKEFEEAEFEEAEVEEPEVVQEPANSMPDYSKILDEDEAKPVIKPDYNQNEQWTGRTQPRNPRTLPGIN